MFWREDNKCRNEKFKLKKITRKQTNQNEFLWEIIKKRHIIFKKKNLIRDKDWYLYNKKKKKKDIFVFFLNHFSIKNNFYYDRNGCFFSRCFFYYLASFETLKLSLEVLTFSKKKFFYLHDDLEFKKVIFLNQTKPYISRGSGWCFDFKNFIFFLHDKIKTIPVLTTQIYEKFHCYKNLKFLLNIKQIFTTYYKEKRRKEAYDLAKKNNLFFLSRIFFKYLKTRENTKYSFTKEILCKISSCNFNSTILKIFENNKVRNLMNLLIYTLFEKAKYDSTHLIVYSKISSAAIKYKIKKNSKIKTKLMLFYHFNQKEEVEKIKNLENFFWLESYSNFSKIKINISNDKYFFLMKKKTEIFSELKFFFFLTKEILKNKKSIRYVLKYLYLFLKSNKNFLKNWIIEILLKYLEFCPKNYRKKLVKASFWRKLQKKTLFICLNFRNKRIFFTLFEIISQINKFI